MSNGDLNTLDNTINIRGYFERILAERDKRDLERDKRYDDRFESQERAVQAALVAQKESTAAALASAEKAVEKAESSQQRVNVTQNEFRGTLADQAAMLMPRSETELLIKDLRSQIEALRGTRREGVGLSADVAARLIMILVPALALVVAVFFATH